MLIVVMLMLVSLAFFSCSSPNLPDLNCTGTVTINSANGLEGVKIKTTVKHYTTTNSAGEFSFSTKANAITIYPELEGYIFEPASIELTAGDNTANFTATKIENLTGTITLQKVIITPTSIVGGTQNYNYISNGKDALKASNINVSVGNAVYNVLEGTQFLYKNQQNQILVEGATAIVCGQSTSIGILINTYFVMGYHEAQTTNEVYSYLYINQPQTNENLKDGNITYTIYGINSPSKTFTFDVSFVFLYQA